MEKFYCNYPNCTFRTIRKFRFDIHMKEHNENNLYDFSNQKYIELNPDMFDKFIPEELRTKTLKIINGILSKYRNE